MIRVIPFLVYLWLIAAHQVFLSDMTSVVGVTINLPAMMVLVGGLYMSETDVCWFGFFVGLVAHIGFVEMAGWYALIMAAIGWLTYQARIKMNLDSRYSRLLVVFSGVLVHNVLSLILIGTDQLFYLLLTQALAGTVYTTVVAWLFFLVKEGKITLQKIRAIF